MNGRDKFQSCDVRFQKILKLVKEVKETTFGDETQKQPIYNEQAFVTQVVKRYNAQEAISSFLTDCSLALFTTNQKSNKKMQKAGVTEKDIQQLNPPQIKF